MSILWMIYGMTFRQRTASNRSQPKCRSSKALLAGDTFGVLRRQAVDRPVVFTENDKGSKEWLLLKCDSVCQHIDR